MDWTNLTEITVSNVEDTDINRSSAREITLNFIEAFNKQNPKFDLSTLAREWVYKDLSESYSDESEFVEELLQRSTTDELYSKIPDRVSDQFLEVFQREINELV